MGILYLIIFIFLVVLFFKVRYAIEKKQEEKAYEKALRENEAPHNNIAITHLATLKRKLDELSGLYIPHSKIITLKEEYSSSYNHVYNHTAWRALPSETYSALSIYSKLEEYAQKHNAEFIQEELKRCSTFFDLDFKNPLDIQQREACLTDEDATLIVAGAGTGKTTTIVGKVKYLIKERRVRPQDIILFSFTHKAAEEMKERLQKALPPSSLCPTVTTFHKFGLDVLKNSPKRIEYDIVGEEDLYDAIHETLTTSKERDFLRAFADFLVLYSTPSSDFYEQTATNRGDFFSQVSGQNFETLRSWLSEAPSNAKDFAETKVSFQREVVKSVEELRIANFLFLNNVKYEYERPYPFSCLLDGESSPVVAHRKYHPDFYLSDYDLYLEHYAIGKDNLPPKFFGENGRRKYLEAIKWKEKIHKQNKTKLICSYSAWNQDDQLIEKLRALLTQNGVKLLSEEAFTPEYCETIIHHIQKSTHGTPISSLEKLLAIFIRLVKAEGYDEGWQHTLQYPKLPNQTEQDSSFNAYDKKRLKKFLLIAHRCYQHYQARLAADSKIDFSDMITLAAKELKDTRLHCKYKYIIVDEFQDISKGRMEFLKSLRSLTDAHLFCVGDDWQSIYRFTGSDLDIFVNFQKYFGYTKTLKIEKTYRNSQDLIDIMGRFITENKRQLVKNLRSPRKVDVPITIIYYGNSSEHDAFNFAKQQIEEYEGQKKTSVFVLGRTNNDGGMLSTADFLNATLQISYLTAHKSKGLEADNVIILNMTEGRIGFPNKIMDDPVLLSILPPTDSYAYAEERRLFYVAVTRARNRVFLLVPETSPSIFINALKRVNKDIKEVFLDSCDLSTTTQHCPHCTSGHLILRKAASGQTFLGCSHFPLCRFSTKEEALYIPQRCPICGAPMVIRQNQQTSEHFLSCSNFPDCRGSQNVDIQKLQMTIKANKEAYWAKQKAH